MGAVPKHTPSPGAYKCMRWRDGLRQWVYWWYAIFLASSGSVSLRAWCAVVLDVLLSRWRVAPSTPLPALRRSGGVAVVTGGNSGIGLETVYGLARSGMRVVMACRIVSRGRQARAALLQRWKAGAAVDIEVMALDLSRQASVRAFAAALIAQYDRLDVLVLNAGVMALPRYTETADGIEAHLGVNHVAHALLTQLLEPRLRVYGGRVVVVSSVLALLVDRFSAADWQQRWSPARYRPFAAYAFSKACNYMWARACQRRGMTALCVHPGDVKTEVVRNLSPPIQRGYRWFADWCLLTPTQGAFTVLYACLCEPDTLRRRMPGTFAMLADGGARVIPMPSWMNDAALGEQLWHCTESLYTERDVALNGKDGGAAR